MIRTAKPSDVPRIQQIISSHAELGKMLFKNYAQLYEDLRDFAVYVEDEKVVACVALGIIWADMAEIRSLAVDEAFRGRGIGQAMVNWCVDDARRMGIRKLMSLTYEQRFFEKLQFVVVSKDTLPLKVWTDCVRCPKNLACDEIAMVRELTEVPLLEAPVAIPTPRGISIPVLVEDD
jgi:amino-acid N-acetyltransferase